MRPSSPSHISLEVHRLPPPSLPPSLASPPMTPVRHAQYHSHLPPSGGSHGHHQAYLHPFLPTYETTSPFPCAGFDLSLCQGGSWEIDHQHGRHQQQEVIDRQFPSSGSIDHTSLPTSTPPLPTKDEESSSKSVPGEGDPSITCPSQWMPSKMRVTRKTMNSDRIDCSKPRRSAPLDQVQHQQQSIGGTNNGSNSDNHSDLPSGGAPVRVCSDCNTTKTPLWRSGPRGPKSLCNACGIRQRKARRAMAAAALSGGMIPAVAPAKVPKEKKQQHGDCAVPIKKRCKFRTVETGKKLHVDEFTISFGNSSAFHHVFPQDEKEAAMLLMALSCGCGLIGHG